MYKFIKTKEPENRFDNTDIEMTVDTVSLSDLLEEFHNFLFACGFSFDGTLCIWDEEAADEADID